MPPFKCFFDARLIVFMAKVLTMEMKPSPDMNHSNVNAWYTHLQLPLIISWVVIQ